MTYTYRWLHVPTGATGNNTLCWKSRRAFLRSLKEWNAANAGWQYWAA